MRSKKHPEEHDVVGERTDAKIEVTDAIQEWDYGDYEGVTSKDIQAQRKRDGLDEWDIWRDGCPGGETVAPCNSVCDGIATNGLTGFLGHQQMLQHAATS